MAFQVIPPRRLYQEIALQIKAHIESGEFSVGARLPAERELAQQLKVSRPSVREAIIALEVEGLVEVKTGAGVFVCERRRPFPSTASYEGPIEIMLARALIEGDIAARAATKMRNADIKELERIVKAMNPSPTGQELCLPSDRAFHLYIAEKAGNTVLARFVAELFDARHSLSLYSSSSSILGAAKRAIKHPAFRDRIELAFEYNNRCFIYVCHSADLADSGRTLSNSQEAITCAVGNTVGHDEGHVGPRNQHEDACRQYKRCVVLDMDR